MSGPIIAGADFNQSRTAPAKCAGIQLLVLLATLWAGLGLHSEAHGQTVTRGPYLQLGTPNSMVVRWRTSTATGTAVRYGTSLTALTNLANNSTAVTDHSITVSGLQAGTKYYYEVGTGSAWYAGDGANDFFTTHPTPGTAKAARIWVLGDAGRANADQRAVRDAYLARSLQTDLVLLLGDNAYETGTDAEYQNAIFDIYPTVLQNTVFWSTRGNHETDAGGATYYGIFTLPNNAQAGGLASGTEAYYSFDYGNIHFICLDSQGSSRSTTGAMANWLRNDLAATTNDWLVAFWHHPPYSKGSHDSDSSGQLIDMRQNFLPILEAGGVDLVLSGHSHSYERSFLLNGHYGNSDTLSAAMILDSGNGRETGSGAYQKPTLGPSANNGAVYVVTGSAGAATGGSLNHPAMFVSLNQLGSAMLEFSGNRLDVTFLRETGQVGDQFTLKKGPSTPPVAPTGLAASGGNSQIALHWSPAATATSYRVKRATTSGGPYTLVASPTSLAYTNTGVVNGTKYYYVVSAVNGAGESPNSAKVNATPLLPAPTAPTNFVAAAGNAQVALSWGACANATSYRVKRAATSGGNYTVIASPTGTAFTDTGRANGTTYYYVVSALNTAGESANSIQAAATPQSLPAAPANLAATAGNAQVLLSWNACAGATSYRVKRATTSGGPYTLLASPTATNFINTGLANGTTYYYVASAFNTAGESPASGQAAATPLGGDTNSVPGDTNGDGRISQAELDAVLAHYWPNSPWVSMTNVANLGTTLVQFTLTNQTAWNFSVQASSNRVNWSGLPGPARPLYRFVDSAASNSTPRFYRLRPTPSGGNTNNVPGDTNGDGRNSQAEVDAVLAHYWADSPRVRMTNVAGLGSGLVQFTITNLAAWNFPAQTSSNLVNWSDLAVPARPMYQFVDPAPSNATPRFYRLRWP